MAAQLAAQFGVTGLGAEVRGAVELFDCPNGVVSQRCGASSGVGDAFGAGDGVAADGSGVVASPRRQAGIVSTPSPSVAIGGT